MAARQQQFSSTTASSSTTRTVTIQSNPATSSTPHIFLPSSGTLRLRAEASPIPQQAERQRRVQWAENVVNNEGLGRKSSKICCIYHKPRPAGESSDEESSDSSSDESDSGDDGAARPSQKRENKSKCHDSASCTGSGHAHKQVKRTPNAYEQLPKNNKT